MGEVRGMEIRGGGAENLKKKGAGTKMKEKPKPAPSREFDGAVTRKATHTNFVTGFVAREVGGNFAQASTDLHKAANRI